MKTIQILIISIAVISLSLLYFFYPATTGSFHPNCIFHEITGLHCPGCGSQRAASALLHGNFLRATGFNILFVFTIPLIIYSAFVFVWNNFSERKLKQAIFYSPFFVKAYLFAVLSFWLLRNLPFPPFNSLAP